MGAALATLLSGTVFLVLWFAFSQPLYRLPVRWGAIALGALAGVLIGAALVNLPDAGILITLAAKFVGIVVAGALVVLLGLVPLRASLHILKNLAAGLVPRVLSRRA
jgi:hypothetical protein